MVAFGGLRDLSDGRFWWVTRSPWPSVLLSYEISNTVGFVSLRVFNDCQFCAFAKRFWLRDFNDGQFCWDMRFQRRSVLFRYQFSMAVGFGGLRDRNDGRFAVSVGFFEFSVPAGFVLLRVFRDCR